MKLILPLLTAATALAAGAAQAQDATPSMTSPQIYGSLGYGHQPDSELGVVQLRLGARLNNYLGVEGELGEGVRSKRYQAGGITSRESIRHQAAAYAVGYLPLTPKADLFARVGYGKTWYAIDNSAPNLGSSRFKDSDLALKIGVGAQYFFDGRNGVRIDYVGENVKDGFGHDTWSVAYTRRF